VLPVLPESASEGYRPETNDLGRSGGVGPGSAGAAAGESVDESLSHQEVIALASPKLGGLAMSVYAALDENPGEQIASNKGWGDFGRWVDRLDVKCYWELVHLREYGWCQHLPTLGRLLRAALKADKPAPDVATVATALLSVIKGQNDCVLVITDGTMAD
jgi:hypothetical protein